MLADRSGYGQPSSIHTVTDTPQLVAVGPDGLTEVPVSDFVSSITLPYVVPTNVSGLGIVDDGPAIQAVLDANPGRTIWLPKPAVYYRITSPLSPAESQRIIGDGSQIRQTTSLANVITVSAKTKVILEGLHLYCVGDRGALTVGAGVLLDGCSRCKINNNIIENCRGGAVTVYNSNDNEVTKNYFISAAVSGAVNDTQVGFDIQVIYSSSRNIISQNHCISGTGSGIVIQSVADGNICIDNVITDNIIANTLVYGIVAYRNSQALPILQTHVGTIIANNNIKNVTGGILNSITGTYTYGAGIYLQGAEDAVVADNVVDLAHSAAVTFASTLAPGSIGIANLTRATVTGNQISNSGANGIDITDANGFGDANGALTVADNNMISSVGRGIRIRTSAMVSLTDNTINITGSHGIEVNLSTTVQCDGIKIVGNSIKGVTGTGINANYMTNGVINDNVIVTTSVAGITAANCIDLAANDNIIKNHTTRGIQIASTTAGATLAGNTVVGTGSSTEGIRLDALTTIGTNRVSGNTNNWVGIYAVLRNTQDATAVGNTGTGEQDLKTVSVPPSSMINTGDCFTYEGRGGTQNNANVKTIRAYFGSQLVLTTILTPSQASAWVVSMVFIRTTPNAQRCFAWLDQGGAVTITDIENINAAEVETAAIVVKLTADATGNNDIQQLLMKTTFTKG